MQHDIAVTKTGAEKPALDFSKEKFEKPEVIITDKNFIVNSPDMPVICMYPEEYDKETRNYKRMLEIIKQYQISEKYYNEIK